MKRMSGLMVALVLLAAIPMGRADEAVQSVTGYVIDSACMYVKKLDKPIGTDCARKCALAGSPLVILAVDGTVYLPISADMPAKGQNERLLAFAGERVVVSGVVYARGGSHAMVIDSIAKAPETSGH